MTIEHDATTEAPDESFANATLTFSHNCQGTNRCLVVCGFGNTINDDGELSGITYNLQSLDRWWQISGGNTYHSSGFYSDFEPATGLNEIVITCDEAEDELLGIANSFTGVDQTTRVGASNTSIVFGQPITVDVTAASTDDLVIDGVFSIETRTIGTGQDPIGAIEITRNVYCSTEQGIDGAVTMSWTGNSGWGATGGGPLKMAEEAPGGETVQIAVAAMAYTGQTLQANLAIALSPAAISYSGQTVKANTAIAIAVAAISYVGKAVKSNLNIIIGKAAILYSGVSVKVNTVVAITAAAISYVGRTLKANLRIIIGKAAILYAGVAIKVNTAVAIVAGAITYLGRAVGVKGAITIAAASIGYLGRTVTASKDVTIGIAAAAIAYAGKTVKSNIIVKIGSAVIRYSGKTVGIIGEEIARRAKWLSSYIRRR